MTIHLVRHGHSSYVHHGRWMNGAGVVQFEHDYNAAGIRDDSRPPPALIEIASRVDVVAASDMRRAIESARRLAPARERETSSLLRGASVLAVTHGGFRRVLDARLIARGWRRAPGRLSYANWSSWAYSRFDAA